MEINRCGRFRAYIWYNGKIIHLGNYDTLEEAKKARIKGEEEYFGEFGYHRSMGKING